MSGPSGADARTNSPRGKQAGIPRGGLQGRDELSPMGSIVHSWSATRTADCRGRPEPAAYGGGVQVRPRVVEPVSNGRRLPARWGSPHLVLASMLGAGDSVTTRRYRHSDANVGSPHLGGVVRSLGIQRSDL